MPLRSYSEAEIVLKARRRLERPLMLLIWLGLASFSLADGSVFYLLAGTAAVAVNLAAVHRAQEVYVSRFFVNAGVLTSTGILVLEVLTSRAELLAQLGHYLILIQICKLFERKTNRDYVQMLVLTMLLMVACSLLTMAFWLAMVVAVHLTLTAYTVMVFTLKRRLDQAAVARLVVEAGPLDAHRVAWNAVRDWPGQFLVRRSVGATIFMLAVGIAMFLVAPREAHTHSAASDGAALSGYSQSVHLGDPTVRRIYLSNRVVLSLQLTGPLPSGPYTRQVQYLRGQVFNLYARSRWSRRAGRMFSSGHESAPAPDTRLLDNALVLNVSQVASASPTLLFSIAPPVEVTTTQGQAQIDGDGEIRFSPPMQFDPVIRYTVRAWPMPLSSPQVDYLRRMRERSGNPPQMPHGLIYAGQAVEQLARQWCRDLLPDEREEGPRSDELNLRLATRLAQRLRDEYEYTLELDEVPGDRDGVEHFLFHSRRGHCEYFASALTVMCHSLHIPARLATGFRLEPASPAQRSFTVRDRDAHAWTEVFTQGGDWVPFDATPPAPAARQTGLFAWARDTWSSMGFWWYENVISYDNRLRQSLARHVVRSIQRTWAAAGSLIRDAGESFSRLLAYGQVDALMVRLAIAVAAIGLVLEAVVLARLVRRSMRERTRAQEASRRAPPQVRFLVRLLELLAPHGVGDRPAQTARHVAAEAARKLDLPRAPLDDLVDLYYRLRWGRQPAAADELTAAERTVDELAEKLRQRKNP